MDRDDLTRAQFERAAELARRPQDPYAVKWSAIHERVAEAIVAKRAKRLT